MKDCKETVDTSTDNDFDVTDLGADFSKGNAFKRFSDDYVEACVPSALKKKKLPTNDSEVVLKDKNAMESTVMSEGSVKVGEVALNETNTAAFGLIGGSVKLNEVAANNSIDYTLKPDAQNK
ncbi:hypothetical protein RIF29_03863 [Crotalaria pallida]|uniref:Uncharacterized protein n=1 Tax=Crotalaria pallida TaxID=3830 RepID=A0AAN9J0L8_CROPI